MLMSPGEAQTCLAWWRDNGSLLSHYKGALIPEGCSLRVPAPDAWGSAEKRRYRQSRGLGGCASDPVNVKGKTRCMLRDKAEQSHQDWSQPGAPFLPFRATSTVLTCMSLKILWSLNPKCGAELLKQLLVGRKNFCGCSLGGTQFEASQSIPYSSRAPGSFQLCLLPGYWSLQPDIQLILSAHAEG